MGAVVIMLATNWMLALVSFATIPLMFFVARWVATHTLAGYRAQQDALGTLNGIIEETITGARVVKAYAAEERVTEEFDQANTRLQHAATRAMTYAMVLPPMVNMANNLGYALVAGAGGLMAVRGLASIGTIVTFIFYGQTFGRPLNRWPTSSTWSRAPWPAPSASSRPSTRSPRPWPRRTRRTSSACAGNSPSRTSPSPTSRTRPCSRT